MMDRPSGPLGQATQSTGRPMADDRGPLPNPINTARRIPNSVRPEVSSSSFPTQVPLSPGQVLDLAREAVRVALDENQTKTAEANGVGNDLKPGVTIELTHKPIQKLPEEVIDIIKHELERLALSHNQISSLPTRLSECTSLRYLNVRNNFIREFPPSICELFSLEILDLSRNKITALPVEIGRLTSLKVLSIRKNRIEELPLCLGDMASLQVLKLDENPLRFPPREILEPQLPSPPNASYQESDIDFSTITSQIKTFLRQKAFTDRSENESGGEESSEGAETPRPAKRVTSGRFPIKVNGTDLPDLRSPAMQRPPPIPSRSHYRGLSQQNAALRRPGVMPLMIGGNVNERLRSNSETVLQANRDRSSDRSRRMGIVSKKASDLGTVDESKANRSSHYRGLSHGSAMQGNNGTIGNLNLNSRSPASPADPGTQRATYVRRLSSLPERKRESISADPVIEAAQGILYSLFQVHPHIQSLLGLARDGTNKRTSLERVFYNATTHVEELDQHIQSYMTYSEEDEEVAPRTNENVRRACETCVSAYVHVCGLLSRNVETLLENGDPRYIRTLLLLVYGSAAEIRNATGSLFIQPSLSQMPRVEEASGIDHSSGNTIRYYPRDKSITPTREKPGPNFRDRSATTVQQPSHLRVSTDVPTSQSYLNGQGRSATMTSSTPRSGESFTSPATSIGRTGVDFTEEDRIFEKIFLRLQQSTEMAIKNLPIVNGHFLAVMKHVTPQANPDQPKQYWLVLVQKATTALQTAESLKARLSLIKLKEPGIRAQGPFWELCNTFIHAYTDLVMKVKEAKSTSYLFPVDTIMLLRPLQKVIKEVSQMIQTSPWSFLAAPQSANGSSNGAYLAHSPASQIPLPMTPQSAALGPAVQATVPSTPQSASYHAMFSGNVFERADALLSMNGGSVASSRAGTMTSNTGQNDGNGFGSMNGPVNMAGTRYNGLNANGKPTF